MRTGIEELSKMNYDELFLFTGDFYYLWLRNASEDGMDCSAHKEYAIDRLVSGACNMCGKPVTDSGYPAYWGISCQCQVRIKCVEYNDYIEKAKEHRKIACQSGDRQEFIVADQYDKRVRELYWEIEKDPQWQTSR